MEPGHGVSVMTRVDGHENLIIVMGHHLHSVLHPTLYSFLISSFPQPCHPLYFAPLHSFPLCHVPLFSSCTLPISSKKLSVWASICHKPPPPPEQLVVKRSNGIFSKLFCLLFIVWRMLSSLLVLKGELGQM